MKNFTKEQELILDFTRNAGCVNNYKVNTNLIKDINWEELLPMVVKHKIFTLLYGSISGYIPARYKAVYEHKYYQTVMMNKIKINELERIIKAADDNHIPLLLLKGFALSQLIYNDMNIRQFNDIDLLVKESDMEKLYYLINDMGYSSLISYNETLKRFNTINKPILLFSYFFHEFQCIKQFNDNSDILIEIKRASSAIPLEHIGDFFGNFEYISIGDYKIRTLNLYYTLLHLLANSYETYEPDIKTYCNYNVRDIIDPYLFIEKYKGELDWNRILVLSRKYEITHRIYYVLNLLTGFYGQVVSKEIIELFSPDKITYSFGGNRDGSMDSWESDFNFRLLNHAERNNELIRCRKKRIYSAKDCRTDKVVNESFSVITNIQAYNHLYVKLLNWTIYYIFSHDDANLYINVIIDNDTYEQLDKYYILILLMDNNPENNIFYRNIIITKDENIKAESENVQMQDFQFIKIENRWMIKATVPFRHLDMRFKDSRNRIYHNIEFREKIGIDAFRVCAKKYDLRDYTFLKIG